MLEMIPDRLNLVFAARAKESEASLGNVQVEGTSKSPQRIGNFRLNQAVWYGRHGWNLLLRLAR
jgi:hypothetical protein